jgi:hypothetical protein
MVKDKLLQSIRDFQLVYTEVEVLKETPVSGSGNAFANSQKEKPGSAMLCIESLGLVLVPRLAQPRFIKATTDNI